MVESFTLSLSGTASVLETHYCPPIELNTNKILALGLVDLLTFNFKPNIDTKCNKFYVGEEVLELPTGSYEIDDIEKTLRKCLEPKGIKLSIKPNNNTLCIVFYKTPS